MTGVGGRPELIIEGSKNGQDWKVHMCIHITRIVLWVGKSKLANTAAPQ